MKPIKFRAWDKDKKWMVYDVQDAYDGLWSERNSDEINDYYGYVSTFQSFTDEESFNFMQYTGLKDKNGVEVYFNDIVEDGYGHRYEVVFEGDCLRCNGLRRIRGGHKPKNRWFGIDLKIIGNRYENPELLKEQNK